MKKRTSQMAAYGYSTAVDWLQGIFDDSLVSFRDYSTITWRILVMRYSNIAGLLTSTSFLNKHHKKVQWL